VNPERRWLWLLIGALLFAAANTQAPLYWSNQNQYFLHGLADAGLGDLKQDWLANTVDPTPAFSKLVSCVDRFAHESVYYVFYAGILGIYFVSLLNLGVAMPGGPRSALGQLRLGLGLIAIHAAIVRWGSVQLLGKDYPWFLQAGVAGQYVLGPMLQPCVFGVLLITAITAFAHDRLVLTVACVALCCTVHPTYLLPAALLTLGFMHVLWWENRRRACIALGAATLLLVAPVAVDSVCRFAPTDRDTFATAQGILVNLRLPHHAVIGQWFDWIAALQIVWTILALVVVRRSRLFAVLLIAFLGALALSLAQLLTKSETLALLFPWRMSAVLVPVATTVILARTITWFHPRDAEPSPLPRPSRAPAILSGIVGAIVATSVGLQFSDAIYGESELEEPLHEFVRTHRESGDVYLLPITVPNLREAARGADSTTFIVPPPVSTRTEIPLEFQRFRLTTGAAIFVDFKSIPYQDAEVVEWYSRCISCVQWTGKASEGAAAKATHVITRADRDLDAAQFERVFADANYKVFRIRRNSK
jgi:hypothetical protein